jgi:hypothetical protein
MQDGAAAGTVCLVKADQLKKNEGWRVQIAPAAIHLDAIGRELPTRNEDWIIRSVTDNEVRLDEASSGLTTKLGTDAIASFTSDPSRAASGGVHYGLLLLKVQMYVKGDNLKFVPCLRPGERVPPPPPSVRAETAAERIARLANQQAFDHETERLATSAEAHRAVEQGLAAMFEHVNVTIARLRSPALPAEVGYYSPRNIAVNLGSIGAYLHYENRFGRVTGGLLMIRFFDDPVVMPGRAMIGHPDEIRRYTAAVIRTPALDWCWQPQERACSSLEVADFVLSEMASLAGSHPPRHFIDRLF